jgi:hypothetical protein
VDSRRTTPICRGDHNLKQAGRRRQMPFAGISGSFGSHWGTGLRPALVGGHPSRPFRGWCGAIPRGFPASVGRHPKGLWLLLGPCPTVRPTRWCGAIPRGFRRPWGTIPWGLPVSVGHCPKGFTGACGTLSHGALTYRGLLSQTQKRRSSMHAHQRCPEAKVLSGPIRRPREALVGARPRGAGLRGWESQGKLPLCPHLPYRVPSEALS